jgi:ABC-2 type transport system permease protein
MTTAFRALLRKDIQLFLVDRRALLMSFAVPIAIGSFFGYVLGGQGDQERAKIPVLSVDQDESAISHEVVKRLSGEKALEVKGFTGGKTAGATRGETAATTGEQARAAVRKGTATVAVIIPPNFGQDAGRAFFGSAEKPEIAVLFDPSHAAERAMVAGILTGDVMQAVSKEMLTGQSGREMVKDSLALVERSQVLPAANKQPLEDLLRSVDRWNRQLNQGAGAGIAQGLIVPYTTREEAVTARQNTRYNGYAHAFAGMVVQFVLFLGIDVGVGLLQQRQRGLWKRFRAAPLSRRALIGSRAVSAAILAFVVVLVNFLFARLVFGVRVEGSMAGFLGVSAALALMTAGFGMLVASIGKTPDATRALAIFATLIVVMLGGAWIPMFLFPQWLQKLTVVVPTRWAMDGLEAMTWRGLGLSAAAAPMGVLLVFALVFAGMAVMRFRWEEEG